MSRTGAELIAAERERQIHGEGFNCVDDDRYDGGELTMAAQAYLAAAPDASRYEKAPPSIWPWSKGWWKPVMNDPIRNLTKSGALFQADAERHRRAGREDDAEFVESFVGEVAKQIDLYLRFPISTFTKSES